MPNYTPYYSLAYFNMGENLADTSNVQREMERFVIIDKQLYGLYSIFGSGVIDGWEVTHPFMQNPGSISVTVGAGVGIIDLVAAETTFETFVENLPPNRTLYIMARLTGSGLLNRSVEFFFSTYQEVSAALTLAEVITSNDGITSINNDIRTKIGFESLIDAAIAAHHHRGSPSKIDLAEETKGQLPGSKIAPVDASKVSEGRLSQSVMPSLNHGDLQHTGVYSHEALDAMVESISGSEDQLMGTITALNVLRSLLFMKPKYNDYDEEWVNAFAIIPGVSPDEFIDFENSTAHINNESGCISGVPVESGSPMTVRWNNEASFKAAYSKTNTNISSTGVSIQRANLEEVMIEGFESASADGDTLSSFESQLHASTSDSGLTADSALKTQQGFGGKFTISTGAVSATFTKTFTSEQDWSDYDELLMDVRCGAITHGAVNFYFVDALGGQSSTFTVIDENEVTINDDPNENNFEERILSIGSFNRRRVTKIVFVAEDVETSYVFHIDSIRLKRTQEYKEQASIRMRYSASDRVMFDSLNYTIVLPTGTSARARVRVSDTLTGLSDALFTSYLNDGAEFSLRGKHAEVEIILLSDSTRSVSPTLQEVELAMTTPSEENGLEVVTPANWAEGEQYNLNISSDPVSIVSIKSPLSVNRTAFLNHGTIMEMSPDGDIEFAITGDVMPRSEQQAFDLLYGDYIGGFSSSKSLVRTSDRRYILADTDNHRIAVFDRDGQVRNIYAGMAEDTDKETDDAIPLTATYNRNTGILYLGFSKTLTTNGEDLTNVIVQYGTRNFRLSDEGADIVRSNSSLTGRVIGITLTVDHQSLIDGTLENIYVYYDDSISSNFNPLFVGISHRVQMFSAPISYHTGLFKPVFATEHADGSGRMWVVQANVLEMPDGSDVQPVAPSSIYPIIWFDPVTDTVIGSSDIDVIEEWGGWVKELDDGRLVVAAGRMSNRGCLYISLSGDERLTLDPLYNSPDGLYPTCVDTDSEGYLWMAESSITDGAGRLARLNPATGSIESQITGRYGRIYAVHVLENDDLIVST